MGISPINSMAQARRFNIGHQKQHELVPILQSLQSGLVGSTKKLAQGQLVIVESTKRESALICVKNFNDLLRSFRNIKKQLPAATAHCHSNPTDLGNSELTQ